MQSLTPLDTVPLFRPLLAELLAVLRALSPADWDRPTVAGAWRVRDVASHLLDSDLRKIAVYRDDHLLPLDRPMDPSTRSARSGRANDRDLSRLVNGLNASGVAYAARLSPRLITDLLEITGGWVADVIGALDPDGPAIFPVSWAGEAASANWMDSGREYTERWHHQAQIRDAIDMPRLLDARWLRPLLDFSVRALPVAYASHDAPDGATVTLFVNGPGTAAWTVVRTGDRWLVLRGAPERPDASITAEPDVAWRLFYNALAPGTAERSLALQGSRDLLEPMLRTRSVIL